MTPDETLVTKHERARLRFQERYAEGYAQIEELVRHDLFPATIPWQCRPEHELPRTAQLALHAAMREAIAGLVRI